MVQLEDLQIIAGAGQVKVREPIHAHTTFRIGGPADYYVEISNERVLSDLITYCREQDSPYFIIGNGSNLLVSDEGYRGVMISTRGLSSIRFSIPNEEDGSQLVRAGCGVMLSGLATQIASRGLTGFEFAAGIPGTLGGAVTMNAGAYGGEIKNVIVSARVLKQDGTIDTLTKEELSLSYRHSIIQEENMVVLEATFAFKAGDVDEILAQMRELAGKRRSKQPLEYGSAGSTFKRPEGHFAGKLIEEAGLRGYRVGDIMVSEKHCGFVVNVGEGTYEQAMAVIHHVQDEVYRHSGVKLELEIKAI